MKVRARDKVRNNDLGAVVDSSATVAKSIQFQSDLGRRMNAKDQESNNDQMIAAAKSEQRSELESQMPVTLKCLSAVSGVDEDVLVILLVRYLFFCIIAIFVCHNIIAIAGNFN